MAHIQGSALLREAARAVVVACFLATVAGAQETTADRPSAAGFVVAVDGTSGERPEITRAGQQLPLGIRPGEILFPGDEIRSRDGRVTFQICSDRSKQTLLPGAHLAVQANGFRLLDGTLSEKTAARFCELPDLIRIPPANLQHYGSALARSLQPASTAEQTETFEQRLAALPETQRQTLLRDLAPLDQALQGDPTDVAALMARAVLLQKNGLNTDAAVAYESLAAKAPGAVQTRALVHDLFEQEVPVRSEDQQTYALIVGVSKYQRLPQEQQLLFAHSDAEIFYRHLRSPAGGSVPNENILFITNELGTKANIQSGIESFLKARARKDDTVVVFIAAHGVVDESGAYIVAHDSDPQDLKTTGLPMQAIQQLMENELSHVGRVLVYVDVCRAGTIGEIRSNTINVIVNNILNSPGEILGLMGSGPKEYSYESSQFGEGHGAFSYFLVRALCGEADRGDSGNGDGETTVDEVVEYVRAGVRGATRKRQNPESIVRIDREAQLTSSPECQFTLAGYEPLSEVEMAAVRSIEVPEGPARRYVAEFEDALAKGEILPETPGSAFLPLERLKSRLSDTERNREKYLVLENRLRVALEDAGQQVLLRYLSGDDEPQTAQNFQSGALYFRAARERLAPQSRILLSKQKFCEGRALIFDPRHKQDPGSALAALEEAARIDPDGAYSFNGLGIAYLEQEPPDFERATLAFRQAVDLAPHWAYPRHNLALTYAQLGNFAAAIASYQEAMRLAPQFAYLPYNLGVIFQRLNRDSEAEKMYRLAIEKAGRLRDEIRGKHLAMAYNALGYLRASTGSPKEAEELYRKALASDENLLEARHNLAALLCGRQAAACATARADEALSLWRQNLEADKRYLPSRLSLARALAARGETSQAITQYRSFIEGQPDYAAAHLALAELLMTAEPPDLQGAARQLDEVERLQPAHADGLEKRGDLESRRGETQAARKAYEAALRYATDKKTRKRIRSKLAQLEPAKLNP
jgi:tetratricopeptide (TPR) repeat protein